MAVERAKFSDNAQQEWFRLRPLKLDLAFADETFDARQQFQKIILPGAAAELAIGDGFEPYLFLLLDDIFNFAVFNRAQRRVVDLAFFPPVPRLP